MPESHDFIVRRTTVDDIDDQFDLMDAVAAERRWIGTEPPIDRAARRPRWEAQINDESKGASFMAEADGRMIGCLGLELAPYGVADLGILTRTGWGGGGGGGPCGGEGGGVWAGGPTAHKLALWVWPQSEAGLANMLGGVWGGVMAPSGLTSGESGEGGGVGLVGAVGGAGGLWGWGGVVRD